MTNEQPPISSGEETSDALPITIEKSDSADSFNASDLAGIIEAIIFASEEPLAFKQLKTILEGDDPKKKKSAQSAQQAGEVNEVREVESDDENLPAPTMRRRRSKKPGVTYQEVKKIIAGLNEEYAERNRSFRIHEISGGFIFQTTKEYGIYIGRMFAERAKRRLTQSALESLAIIAFRQPISKPEIEDIRGVGADFVIKSLLEKNLIKIVGRDEGVGRPLLYGTTDEFLLHFGLNSIEDMPKPREIEELLEEEESLGALSIEELDEEETEETSPAEETIDIFATNPIEPIIEEELDQDAEAILQDERTDAPEPENSQEESPVTEEPDEYEIETVNEQGENRQREDDFEFDDR